MLFLLLLPKTSIDSLLLLSVCEGVSAKFVISSNFCCFFCFWVLALLVLLRMKCFASFFPFHFLSPFWWMGQSGGEHACLFVCAVCVHFASSSPSPIAWFRCHRKVLVQMVCLLCMSSAAVHVACSAWQCSSWCCCWYHEHHRLTHYFW